MIELIDQNSSLWIPGQLIPKANINMDYRVKNIPSLLIKNPTLRRKKERMDLANAQKDLIALTIRKYAADRHFKRFPSQTNIFICARIVFKSKTHDNPAKIKIDLDNCEKLFYDAVQASGVIEDDCQITAKIIMKAATRSSPGIAIHSLCFAESLAEAGLWMRKTINRLPSVYCEGIANGF